MNGDDGKNVASLAQQLEKLVAENSAKELRGYVVDVSGKATKGELEKLVADNNITKIGVAYLDGNGLGKLIKDWELNVEVKNTVLYSKDRTVEFNAANLTAKDFGKLADAVKKSLSQ